MSGWSQWVSAKAWRRIVLLLVCVAPLLAGVVSRLTRDRPWFGDYDAIACAGEKIAAGQPIYDSSPECAGMNAVGYVYLPWVAQAHAAASDAIGADVVRGVYTAVYIAAVLALGWIAFAHPMAPGGFWDRAPAFGLVTGSTIYWGNIALPLHAALMLAALGAARRPALFALVLASAATVKPMFLTYGLVLLAAPIPLWRRFAYGAAASVIGLLPMVLFQLDGGALQAQWAANVEHFVYATQPGDGFMGWVSLVGGDPGSLAAQAGWGGFAVLVTLAVIVLAERGGMSPQHRMLMALGAGVLANPRIVPLDVVALALLVGGLVQAARTLSLEPRERSMAVGLAIGSALVGGLGNALDAGDYAPKLATLGLFACLIWLGVIAAQRKPLTAH
jgi:hypothetical protein